MVTNVTRTVRAPDILAARVLIRDVVFPTPVERSAALSTLLHAEVFMKLECAQVTGSFKVRGAANALLTLAGTGCSPHANADLSGVIACSAGNHALGVAHVASRLGIETTLVLPSTASPAKIHALQQYPVALTLCQARENDDVDPYGQAEREARRLAHDTHRIFVSPYNDPAVIAGQGTIGLELLEQVPLLDIVLVPVGGGGLISGIAVWCKAVNPQIRIIGIQPAASAVLAESLKAGHIVSLAELPTLADGLAGAVEADTITLPLMQAYVDGMILVTEEEIADAMRWLFDEHHLMVEGSGAVGIAALLHGRVTNLTGQRVATVLTGRNTSAATIAVPMR